MLASLIAVIGIIVVVNKMFYQLEANLSEDNLVFTGVYQKEIKQFFVKVVLIESIPLLLYVYGLLQIFEVTFSNAQNIMIPMFIVVFSFVFGVFSIITYRSRTLSRGEVPKDRKTLINTMTFIAIGLLGAIPMISFVGLVLMGSLV